MRIGFDLDKIFINTPLFVPDKVINKFYKKRDDGVLLYRIPNYSEQLLRKATHLPFLRLPIKENLDFLKRIAKKDNNLYLISSRYKFLEKETTRIIKKYQLDKIFNSMHFNFENKQPHHFKNEILKKLNLDIYVDDDLSLLKHVAKNNPKTKFYWLNYTRNKQILPKNIIEIKKLEEILKNKF
jgi:hypothetical protein